jgi:hypothetical protein
MSPMLMAAFADAMAELADTMDRLDELAPDYIRDCLESATNPRLLNRPSQRPRELSALAAKLVRDPPPRAARGAHRGGGPRDGRGDPRGRPRRSH